MSALIAWLRTLPLGNSWMADYSFVCFMAHSMGMAFALLLVHCRLPGLWWPACAVAASLAAIKEFVYDMLWESPRQTWLDSLEDFGGYCAGILLSIIATA